MHSKFKIIKRYSTCFVKFYQFSSTQWCYICKLGGYYVFYVGGILDVDVWFGEISREEIYYKCAGKLIEFLDVCAYKVKYIHTGTNYSSVWAL